MNKGFKEFLPSSWAIDHSTVVYVLISIFFILGFSSYLSLPRENFPEINSNVIFVSSVYPGNTAEDVERLITDPLEEELKGVSNLVGIKSTSQENISLIAIEFDENILKENMEVKIEFYEEKPLIVTLPKSADYEILETEAVVKGQTVSSSYKPAIIQNNVKIMVPPFIN